MYVRVRLEFSRIYQTFVKANMFLYKTTESYKTTEFFHRLIPTWMLWIHTLLAVFISYYIYVRITYHNWIF